MIDTDAIAFKSGLHLVMVDAKKRSASCPQNSKYYILKLLDKLMAEDSSFIKYDIMMLVVEDSALDI